MAPTTEEGSAIVGWGGGGVGRTYLFGEGTPQIR
jgi:hypothetical protein